MIEYSINEVILKVEDLSVFFGDHPIIKNISFVENNISRSGISQGQTIAFVGRSGRGKSTLFRALAGLVKPTNGKILIPDYKKNINSFKEVEEGIFGFINQKYTLFRHKTVFESLTFALRKTNLSFDEKKDKINHLLNQWGMTKVAYKYPNEMSGGERQRTAILEQILSSRHFIILDEPFSGLDVGNIQKVKETFDLITSNHELNTLIFSTHDIELAVELADAIYIIGYPSLQNGKLAHYGTIINHYDLKSMGMAWKKVWTNSHTELCNLIKRDLLSS